ncbi:MAG: hypothetical protein HQ514_04900 [Rhodospirillales bacterium]|nr:hypothetical protein [Rhodospirillales bacterium]
MTQKDAFLARMSEAFSAAQKRRYDFVLKHWVERLEKHGLPGSKDGARKLADRVGSISDTKNRDEDWWVNLARDMGGDLGGAMAIGLVQDVMIDLMENDRREIAKRNKSR